MSQSPGRLGRQYLGTEIYQSPIWNDIYLPVNCNLNKTNTPVAKTISDNAYVSNIITAVATVEQQDEFYKEAKFLF